VLPSAPFRRWKLQVNKSVHSNNTTVQIGNFFFVLFLLFLRQQRDEILITVNFNFFSSLPHTPTRKRERERQ
jgi:hypothetical protein